MHSAHEITDEDPPAAQAADAPGGQHSNGAHRENSRQIVVAIYHRRSVVVPCISRFETSLYRRGIDLVVVDSTGGDPPYRELARYGDQFRYLCCRPEEIIHLLESFGSSRMRLIVDFPPRLLRVVAWFPWVFAYSSAWTQARLSQLTGHGTRKSLILPGR